MTRHARRSAEPVTAFGATIHVFHWDHHAWTRIHTAIEHLAATYHAATDRQLGVEMALTALPALIVAAAFALDSQSYWFAAAFVAAAAFTALTCISLLTAHQERTRR